jgi:hypothetical protein
MLGAAHRAAGSGVQRARRRCRPLAQLFNNVRQRDDSAHISRCRSSRRGGRSRQRVQVRDVVVSAVSPLNMPLILDVDDHVVASRSQSRHRSHVHVVVHQVSRLPRTPERNSRPQVGQDGDGAVIDIRRMLGRRSTTMCGNTDAQRPTHLGPAFRLVFPATTSAPAMSPAGRPRPAVPGGRYLIADALPTLVVAPPTARGPDVVPDGAGRSPRVQVPQSGRRDSSR